MNQLSTAMGKYPISDERRLYQRYPAVGIVRIQAQEKATDVRLIDVSLGGLAVKGSLEVSTGDRVEVVSVNIDDQEYSLTQNSWVTWLVSIKPGVFRTGIRFTTPGTEKIARVVKHSYLAYLRRIALEEVQDKALSWEIKNSEQGQLVVFTGVVDEDCDFHKLANLSGKVTFDLAGIWRISSGGVSRWIDFINSMGVSSLSFVHCSIPVVMQINMIQGFKGPAEVQSFYAPYSCINTGVEEEWLLTRDEVNDPFNPPSFPCEGGKLELDEIPERYFSFLISEK